MVDRKVIVVTVNKFLHYVNAEIFDATPENPLVVFHKQAAAYWF
jgi:hypothetical protein